MLAAALTLLGVAAYGGLHSLLATHWAKDQARRLFGQGVDRIYRLAYNIVGALTLIPVLAIPARLPGRSLYQVPWPWAGLALALQLAALLVVVLGVMQTDAWHFLGLRQLVGAEQHPPKLVV
ncbi:MAG: hypothetical protein GTO63_14845, partial [Anaerolineae bacterium]|nr:hypothetical protein [Anaerolineae bacterium]NIN96125.1 hypothetical protein [Anaerolineae bacterium]